jgi:hypothetical protein
VNEMADSAPVSVPRIYVTEISVPRFDDGIQRLCSHMRPPEPLPELDPEWEAGL